jgi:glutaredoxin-related protein
VIFRNISLSDSITLSRKVYHFKVIHETWAKKKQFVVMENHHVAGNVLNQNAASEAHAPTAAFEKIPERWCTSTKHAFDLNDVSKVHFLQRQRMVECLHKFSRLPDSPTLLIFGGLVRRSVVSNHMIQNNQELQRQLQATRGFHSGENLSKIDLSRGTLIPWSTDIDVTVKNCHHIKMDDFMQTVSYFFKDELHDLEISVRKPHGEYNCHTLFASTHSHPLAPKIKVSMDVVFDNRSYFPDFTSNQLCINVLSWQCSVMSCGSPYSRISKPWWWTIEQIYTSMQLGEPPLRQPILTGGCDVASQATALIQEQVKNMTSFVLLYSFARWRRLRQECGEDASVQEYTNYVYKIVEFRLPKLLHDGFTVHGFEPNVDSCGLECPVCNSVVRFTNVCIQLRTTSGELVENETFLPSSEDISKIRTTVHCGGCEQNWDLVQVLL